MRCKDYLSYLAYVNLFLIISVILSPILFLSAEAAAPGWVSLTANPTSVDAGDNVEIRASVSGSTTNLVFGCVREVPSLSEKEYEFFCEDHDLDAVQSSNNLVCRGKAPFKEGEIILYCLVRNLGGESTDLREVKLMVNPLSENHPPTWRGLSIREGNSFEGGDVITVVADGAYDADGDGLYFGCTREVSSVKNPLVQSNWNPNFGGELIEKTWADVEFGNVLEPIDYLSEPLNPIEFESRIVADEYEFFCNDHGQRDPQQGGNIICQGRAPFSDRERDINLICGLHDGGLDAEPLAREISFKVLPKSSLNPPEWSGEFELNPIQETYRSGDEIDILMKGVYDLDDENVFFQCVDGFGDYICEHDIRESQSIRGVNGVRCKIKIPFDASSSYDVSCSIHDGLNHAIFEGKEIFGISVPLSGGGSETETMTERRGGEERETARYAGQISLETPENRVLCSQENVAGAVCDSTGVQQPAIFSKSQCKGMPAQISSSGGNIANPIFDPRVPFVCNEKKNVCTGDRKGVIMYSFDDCCQEGKTVSCSEGMECRCDKNGIGVCKISSSQDEGVCQSEIPKREREILVKESEAPIEEAVVTLDPCSAKCFDSDGGNNPLIPGAVTFINPSGKQDVTEDSCNGNTLTEKYCDTSCAKKQEKSLCGERTCIAIKTGQQDKDVAKCADDLNIVETFSADPTKVVRGDRVVFNLKIKETGKIINSVYGSLEHEYSAVSRQTASIHIDFIKRGNEYVAEWDSSDGAMGTFHIKKLVVGFEDGTFASASMQSGGAFPKIQITNDKYNILVFYLSPLLDKSKTFNDAEFLQVKDRLLMSVTDYFPLSACKDNVNIHMILPSVKICESCNSESDKTGESCSEVVDCIQGFLKENVNDPELNKDWNLLLGISREGFGSITDDYFRNIVTGLRLRGERVILANVDEPSVGQTIAHETGHLYGFSEQYAVQDPTNPKQCEGCNTPSSINPVKEEFGCDPQQAPLGDIKNSCCGYAGTCNTREGREQCDEQLREFTETGKITKFPGCRFGKPGFITKQEKDDAAAFGTMITGQCPIFYGSSTFEGGIKCFGNKNRDGNGRSIMGTIGRGLGTPGWSQDEWTYLFRQSELRCDSYG